MNHPDLAKQVVVITGAGTGIGRAIAVAFAKEGSKVVGVGRTIGPLQDAMSDIVAMGGDAIALRGDVTDEAQIQAAFGEAMTRYGRIDVLVNNAGFGPRTPTPIMETELSEWNSIISTSLTGTMLCSKYVTPYFIEHESGTIVNVSSLAGKIPRLGMGPYCAAKAGQDHLTRVLALELARHNIRVNGVAPGTTRTEHLQASLDRNQSSWNLRVSGNLDSFRSPIPLGRVSEPSEQAAAVLFLASEAAGFMTGQILYVDGGAGML